MYTSGNINWGWDKIVIKKILEIYIWLCDNRFGQLNRTKLYGKVAQLVRAHGSYP